MGKLQIISVTGAVPHTACFFDYADIKYLDNWLAFAPAKHHSPGWPSSTPGKVFTNSEAHRINHGIEFDVSDSVMLTAYNTVFRKYSTKNYKVGVVDCVSLSADVARECNLRVPYINMTPYGLIQILAVWNTYIRKW